MSQIQELMWVHTFEQNPNCCWVTDNDGRILEANSAAQQYAVGEHSHLAQALYVDSLPIAERSDIRLSDGQAFTLRRREMGQLVLWELCNEPSISKDLKLRQLGALSGGLFHAIRNPLTIVQGRIELLQMLAPDPKMSKNFNIVMEQCGRIRQLLDTTQGITIQKKQMTQFSVLTLLQGYFEGKSIHASNGFQYVIFNDQSRIRILMDILQERLTVQGEVQHVTLNQDSRFVEMTIQADLSNEGWQFWSTLQQVLLEPSGLAQTGSTREQHLQSFNILFRDCNLTYSLILGQQISIRFPSAQEQQGNHQILIVDDDLDLRETLVDLLSMDGFHILNVNSAEEAIAVLNDDLDVILLDINLPGMSGLTLVERLRESNPRLLSRIVLISGLGSLDVPADVLFLQKPFSKQSLNQIIQRVILSQS